MLIVAALSPAARITQKCRAARKVRSTFREQNETGRCRQSSSSNNRSSGSHYSNRSVPRISKTAFGGTPVRTATPAIDHMDDPRGDPNILVFGTKRRRDRRFISRPPSAARCRGRSATRSPIIAFGEERHIARHRESTAMSRRSNSHNGPGSRLDGPTQGLADADLDRRPRPLVTCMNV
jgi:hypothetical protein